MNIKENYKQFCKEEKSLPIFFQDWWLDAVCGEDNWNAVIAMKGGQTVAVMPYYIKRKYGFKLLHMPPLTSMLGPWIRQVESKYERQIGYQNEIMTTLIEELPAFDSFYQNWHYGITNWLPFYWKGFHQSTAYTYVIEGIRDTKRVWNDFKKELRTRIRKLCSRVKVDISQNGTLEDIIRLNKVVFARQSMRVPFDEEVFRRLDLACKERDCSSTFFVHDESGNPIAGTYIVWDKTSAYCMIGGRHHVYDDIGARSVVMWEAILFTSQFVDCFDFRGSMIESIETFCCSFGGKQKRVFCISRIDSLPLAVHNACSNLYDLMRGGARQRL